MPLYNLPQYKNYQAYRKTFNILLLTIKFPFKWYHWRKQPMKLEPKINDTNLFLLHSGRHFFTSGSSNGHNSAILAPINFFLPPFYSSRASDSDGILKNHVTKNGCRVPLLRDGESSEAQDARFIASCPVSPCIHKNIFYTKRKGIS